MILNQNNHNISNQNITTNNIASSEKAEAIVINSVDSSSNNSFIVKKSTYLNERRSLKGKGKIRICNKKILYNRVNLNTTLNNNNMNNNLNTDNK